MITFIFSTISSARFGQARVIFIERGLAAAVRAAGNFSSAIWIARLDVLSPTFPVTGKPSTTYPMPKPYLLFFRNTGPEVFESLAPNQRQQLIDRWNSWYDQLAKQGKAVEGQPLEAETRVVGGAGGARVIDGPFAEAKEAIGGYVKLLVDDLEEATAIARQHPALEHGMKIEIRAMTPDCHLGVCAHHPATEVAPAAK